MIKLSPTQERLIIFILGAIQFIQIMDFVVIMPLGPTLMNDLSIGPIQFGALVSSYNFAAAFAAIFLSTFADRFDRKHLLCLSSLGFLLSAFGCFLADSYHSLLVARVITGMFGGFLNALTFTLVADLIPFIRRGKAMAVMASAFSVASVIGIPSGLLVSDYFGWSYTFLYISILTLFVTILVFVFVPNVIGSQRNSSPLEVLKKYWLVLHNKHYLKTHAFMLSVSMSMFVLIPFLSPYAVRNMMIEIEQIKYMYLIGGLVTIITARFFGQLTDKLGSFSVFRALALISMIPVILYSHSGEISFVMYLLIGSLFMTFVSGRMIPCMTMISEVPSVEDRGSYMSVMNAVRSFGTASATLISGAMITESSSGPLVGYQNASYLSLALIFLSIVLASRLRKQGIL
jgi:predicted MFS family arabinose efflux permease